MTLKMERNGFSFAFVVVADIGWSSARRLFLNGTWRLQMEAKKYERASFSKRKKKNQKNYFLVLTYILPDSLVLLVLRWWVRSVNRLLLSFPIDDYPQVISAVVDWFASLELTRECVGVIKWMGTLHRCWHVTKAVSEHREIFSVRFARNSQTDSTFIANEIRKTVFFYLFSWFVAENWITKKGSLYYFHYEYLQRNGAHPLILLSLW